MPSSGFQLSALPVAPQIPASVGEFNAARAKQAALDQLELARKFTNYGPEQEARQAQLALEAKKAKAAQVLVDPQAQADLASANLSAQQSGHKSQILSEAGDDLRRSSVLSAQADVGKQEDALSAMSRTRQLREQSKGQIADVQKRFADAGNLADHDAEANELERIRSDYPFIDQLPEYKNQAKLLDDHIKAARARALDMQKAGAAQSRAETIAAGGVDRAKITADAGIAKAGVGKPGETSQLAAERDKYAQLAAGTEDPDEQEMYQQHAAVIQKRLDKLTAPTALPGAAQAQKMQMGARHAADAAAANADRMSELIDRIIPRVTRTGGAGVGSILSVLPESSARALASDIDTLKANIGFNELNTLRQQSPTGGALGQVSERELHFLQNVIASLDTKLAPDVLRANLARAKVQIKESAARIRAAYEQDFGPKAALGAPAAAAPAAAVHSPEEISAAKAWLQANPNDPRAAQVRQAAGLP